MMDIERYLNSIEFTTVVDEKENPNSENENGLHYVFQKYVSPVVNDEIDISCGFHYNIDRSKEIDYIMITICSKEKIIAKPENIEELKDHYKSININKKLKIYKQWQYKQFAKEMMKNGFRDLKFGFTDLFIAQFKILKIRLRRKQV